jgi:hypothetical protein
VGVGNFVPGLEHGDRICKVDIFDIPSSYLENVSAEMQQPVPAPAKLPLGSNEEMAPSGPNVFLNGDIYNNVTRGLSI